MAQIFGGKNKYLIFMERFSWATKILYALVFIYIVWAIFFKNYKYLFSIPSIIVLIILFGPFIYISLRSAFKQDREEKGYRQGRKGEGAIYYELLRLSNDFYVFQHARIDGLKCDIDFIVLGPTGIFAIEVKSHTGTIEFNGKELLRNKHEFEKDVLGQTMGEARSLHAYIKEKTGRDFLINPVLLFSSNQAHMNFVSNKINNVIVAKRPELIGLIKNNNHSLSAEDIELLKNVLENIVKVESEIT